MANESNLDPAAPEKWALGRRDFLIMGSAAVAGAAASSVTAATIAPLAIPAAGAVLSVGFSEQLAAGSGVVAAERLRLRDERFLDGGARVTVLGAWQPRVEEPVFLRLSTFFPHLKAEGRIPFLAWSSARIPGGVDSVSGPVTFVAPLDENGTLPVSVERVGLAAASPRRLGGLLAFARGEQAPKVPNLAVLERAGSVCRLNGGHTGDVRLRAGTYFIALRRTMLERAPNWSSVSIDAEAGTPAMGMLRAGTRPVDFEYIALTIDYAKA
ncbi:MAG TPA: hypothetical protein VGF28_06310 [Thermoanaerobaculia bacterium]